VSLESREKNISQKETLKKKLLSFTSGRSGGWVYYNIFNKAITDKKKEMGQEC